MAEPCAVCGTTEAETYRFCSPRRDFVCIMCERSCPNYSSKLLPNGTNCRITIPQQRKYSYLTISADVFREKKRLEKTETEHLKSLFAVLEKKLLAANEASDRANIRTSLAAMEQIFEERRICLS